MLTRPIKNIVIVGAGPIGLYTAMRLKQLYGVANKKLNITVVDGRAGNYNRPGVIANQALALLESGLNVQIDDVTKPTANSMFIQDLEKSLYKKASKMGVNFVNSNFKSFNTKSIVLVDSLKQETSLPCDFLCDCTGQAHVLITKANELYKKIASQEPFQITRVSDNPIKSHFIAYISMDSANAALAGVENKDVLASVLALETLRVKFGWDEFISPTVDTGKWEDPQTGRTSAYYYFETPATLQGKTNNEYIDWLTALLNFRSGNDVQFEAEKGLKFTPFKVDPHQVRPAVNEVFGMMLAPAGDAQIAPDYRRGHGVESGINRANALIDSFFLQEGEIYFNTRLYEQLLELHLGKHIDLLTTTYKHRKSELEAAPFNMKSKYLQALEKATQSKDREVIQLGLNAIYARILLLSEEKLGLPKQSEIQMNRYKEELTKNTVELNARKTVFVNSFLSTQAQLMTQKPGSKQEVEGLETEYLKSKKLLVSLAQNYKDIAGRLFAKNNLVAAKKYYRESLEIYTSYLKSESISEIAKIYSNLAIIENKRKNYDEAISNAKFALALCSHEEMNMADQNKFVSKINFNLCSAILNKAVLVSTKPSADKHAIEQQNFYREAQALYKKIDNEESGIEKKELSRLKLMLENIEQIEAKTTPHLRS